MEQYIKLFNEQREVIDQHAPELLNMVRDTALTRFQRHGFPTNKEESYLYTRVLKNLSRDYGINLAQRYLTFDQKRVNVCGVSQIQSMPYYMVNGAFYAVKNVVLPQGIHFLNFRTACKTYPDLVARYFNQLLMNNEDPMVNFNAMFAQNGYFLYVEKNVVMDKPLQIVSVADTDIDLMVHTRNLIVLDEGSDVKILLCQHALNKTNYYVNDLTEVFVGENAKLQYYNLEHHTEQTDKVSQMFVQQRANSRLVTNFIGLTNGATRNVVDIDLVGPGAETWLGGMLVSDKEQKTENFTVIRHKAPHCTSTELFKYILDDHSEGAFSGRVVVEDGAQKTISQQTNRNILLTSEAQMHAKPQLEIYADDVKCGHGATTGQIDDSALFYMQQRGIGLEEARMLLLEAFTSDVLDHIEMPAVKESISNMVRRRLRKEKTSCENCHLC